MTTKICFGIPHRVGACACQIGTSRENASVATETTAYEWADIVAGKPIDPKHSITAVSYTDKVAEDGQNDDATQLVTSIRCWPEYANPEETDPKIIIKSKGDVKPSAAKNSFPAITITMRPLKTVLDYSYGGNLNASGQGEIGYESANSANDLLKAGYFKGPNLIPWQAVCGAEDPGAAFGAVNNAYSNNNAMFKQFTEDELGGIKEVVYQDTQYWKSTDIGEGDPTFKALTGLEIKPLFHPRLPSNDEFNFKINESFDCRYRYPVDWLNVYGEMTLSTGQPIELPAVICEGEAHPKIEAGIWSWKTHKQAHPGYVDTYINPIFNTALFNTTEGIAPVIKGWYWADKQNPPSPTVEGLVKSLSFKMLKQVRPRYSFSFSVEDTRPQVISSFDHTPGNQMLSEDIEAAPYYTKREPAVYSNILNFNNMFNCKAWWRMEVTADLCGWNSKNVLEQVNNVPTIKQMGIKIKGIIKIKAKQLKPGYNDERLYSKIMSPNLYEITVGSMGLTESYVYRCVTEPGLDGAAPTVIEYDAGEIPWEVTLTKDNAKDKPIKFLDFEIQNNAELPNYEGDNVVGQMTYISDIIVSEVILP